MFDQTLLAVIGVLDEIKLQQNVAAWIRAGGLWGSGNQPNVASANTSTAEAGAGPRTSPTSSPIAAPPAPISHTSETPIAMDADAQTAEDSIDANDHTSKRKEAKRQRTLENETSNKADVDGEEVPPSSPTGNDAVSSIDPAQTAAAEGAPSEIPAPSLWFDHAPTMKFWVEKGKKALERLGIPIEHGIER